MSEIFSFTRQGRTLRTLVILSAIYLVLIGAIVLIDAAWWLMGALAFLTLPALLDLWRNPSAGLSLTADQIEWYSGRRNGTLALHEIDRMRFDTRWDFSVRMTVELRDGSRMRLPYEATPPHRMFEKALQTLGVTVERHHFTVF